ncbi:MAG: hypothetical protein NTW66_00020 [Candidatus Magasanikbacteria bacterium]|nr:hypothetical protein [Candidatus Magasanikbacteria bacterium]
MNSKQLKRLFNLIRETGDRLIIADNESDDVFAVMSLPEYENLAQLRKMDWTPDEVPALIPRQIGDLNEQEMLEKINHDIADWRGVQKKNEAEMAVEDMVESNIEAEDAVEEIAPDSAKKTAMPRIADVLNDEVYRERKFDDKPRVGWVEEEDLSTVPHEEEKFYLEPVE